MFNNYPSAFEEERYPYIPEEQDLGTPARLEAKLIIKRLLDTLIGTLEDGTLELDEFGADGFECGINGKEVAVGTEENVEGDGRDYCISIGEVLIGGMNETNPQVSKAYDIYLDKQYMLEPFGDFIMTTRADLLFEGEVSSEEIVEALETEKELEEEESEVLEGHYLVTEGEAQDLIQLLSDIVDAQG
jgi:hypothetical protein